jgi:uncharacterized membrane protein (DUF2068 family)
MAETETRPAPRQQRPQIDPLRWIGVYKLFKAVLAVVGGLMVLRLMHRSIPDMAVKWMGRLHIDPNSHAGHLLLRAAVEFKPRRLSWVAGILFVYVPLFVIEGIGLIRRRLWAEWLTVVSTAILIPPEVYELTRRVTWVRILILLVNVVVVLYLILRIWRDRVRRQPTTAQQHSGSHHD